MSMPKKYSYLFCLVGLLAVLLLGCRDGGSDSPSNVSSRIYLMTMQDGTLVPSGNTLEYTLTLKNIQEEALWYTDRPARQSGTETVGYFIDIWETVYGDTAPNAMLDGYVAGNTLNDGLFLSLYEPQYDRESKQLVFKVILENSTMEDKIPEDTLTIEDIKITILDNNNDSDTDTYSFAQTAPSAYFEETDGTYKLYLNNVNPESYYLADAPDRLSFVYPVELFELAWSNIFGDIPPNASLTSYTDTGELKIHIVTLDEPGYDEATQSVSYTITLLHGDITNNQMLNSPTLFIDAEDSPSCDALMGQSGFTKRLTVINSCGENTWLYMLTPGAASMPEQWDWWETASGGEVVWSGGSPDAGDKFIRSNLEIGVPYHFCIPDRGAPSGNFRFFMEPCNNNGDDCMIGTMAGHDRNGTNTLFEPSFGCIPGTDNCAKNPSTPEYDITAVDYFDVSSVDGFTIPMYLEVANADKLTCSRSSTDASMLDMASCPSENKPSPDGYGTTMVAVDPAPASTCDSTGTCTGTGYAPCNSDADCTDGNTQMRAILNAGFSLLTQGVDGRAGYQGCSSPCKYLTGHQLGTPPKVWNNANGNPVGSMADAGNPANTLPLNTASWYCCGSSAGAAPSDGGKECDQGPLEDTTYPVALTGYARRLKELGMRGYAWQFDDHEGLMNCEQQSKTNSAVIVLTLCPGDTTGALYPSSAGSKPYLTTRGWNWVNEKCSADNQGGTYNSLYECQTANMQYSCDTVQSGADDNPVYHKYCRPITNGDSGQTYEDCRLTCQ